MIYHQSQYGGSFAVFQFRDAWWWQAGFPRCLPDDDASGPFPTEQDAINAGVAAAE